MSTTTSVSPNDKTAPYALPQITVQDEFTSVLSGIRTGVVTFEDFWLSCYRTGRTSVHGKVRASLDRRNILDLEGREGVGFECKDEFTYVASCPSLDTPSTQVSVPRHALRDLRGDGRDDGSVNIQPSALAVKPGGEAIAVGYADGRVRSVPLSQAVHESLTSASNSTSNPSTNDVNGTSSKSSTTATTFTPHLSGTAVTTLAFFPPSARQAQSLLSGGVDGILHLLRFPNYPSSSPSASTSSISPICSLKGHFRPITSAVPLGPSKAISVSRDRSLRLWDLASAAQIRMDSLGSGANALTLSSTPGDDGESNTTYVALDSGKVALVDLRAPDTPVSSFATSSSSLTSVVLSQPSNLLATGDSRGIVRIYDVRSLSPSTASQDQTGALHSFTRGSAEITSLAFSSPSSPVSLAVCSADWLPFVASIDSDSVRVRAELAGAGGSDCAPVRAFAACEVGGSVWAAGEDGAVRVFTI